MLALALFALTSAATISFTDKYETLVDGPIYAGTNVTVKYDYARAKCPLGSYAGLPTQGVSMYYTLNGNKQDPIRVHWYQREQPESVHVDAVIPSIPKGDLAIWFICGSRAGSSYDSDFGKNFNFKVVDLPKLVFKSDFTNEVQDGPLVAGGSAQIDYSLERAKCTPFSKYGFNNRDVYMHYAFNGKEVKTVKVSYYPAGPGTPVVLEKPLIQLEKGQLAVWFECTSPINKVFDSNFSNNWVFTIA